MQRLVRFPHLTKQIYYLFCTYEVVDANLLFKMQRIRMDTLAITILKYLLAYPANYNRLVDDKATLNLRGKYRAGSVFLATCGYPPSLFR